MLWSVFLKGVWAEKILIVVWMLSCPIVVATLHRKGEEQLIHHTTKALGSELCRNKGGPRTTGLWSSQPAGTSCQSRMFLSWLTKVDHTVECAWLAYVFASLPSVCALIFFSVPEAFCWVWRISGKSPSLPLPCYIGWSCEFDVIWCYTGDRWFWGVSQSVLSEVGRSIPLWVAQCDDRKWAEYQYPSLSPSWMQIRCDQLLHASPPIPCFPHHDGPTSENVLGIMS